MCKMLNLTVRFGHDIVDGAPVARFAQSFRSLPEAGLEEAHHGLQPLQDE